MRPFAEIWQDLSCIVFSTRLESVHAGSRPVA